MADSIFEQAIEAILKGDADKATEIAKRGIDVCTANVCSILFSLKIFIKNGFLSKKLMFILADFRKNNPCGDSLETRNCRKRGHFGRFQVYRGLIYLSILKSCEDELALFRKHILLSKTQKK